MSPSTKVVSATSDVLKSAAETLARAFENNPWTAWVVPADERLARLTELFDLHLAHAHAYGRVLLAADATGVITLLPADAPPGGHRHQQELKKLHGDLYPRLQSYVPTERPRGSWRVETLGVEPELQRQSIGSTLLVQALTETNELDVTVTLETSEEQNLRLYERYGFVITEHHEPGPDSRPEIWAMTRSR